MKNIHKIIIFNILFSTVNFLFSSGVDFYDIKPYYDNGDFSNLRVYLHQKEDEILSGKRSLDEEYQLLYIKIFEAKSLFCLGKLDSASSLMHEIQSNETYKNLLFHDLHSEHINDCEHDQCICNKYEFSAYESMDAWYNKDKLFASVWIVVKKIMGASNEYYQIPEPTVVKYNASLDVMYMIKGPEQSIQSRPKPNFEDDDDIIKYDRDISQYNRINYINEEFMSMARGNKISKILEFNELYEDGDLGATWSLRIPYLPIIKDEWYKLYIMDTKKYEISRNSFRLKKTQRSHQQNYKLFIRWNQDWTLHEAIDEGIIRLEFPEEYLSNSEDIVFSLNGENIVFSSDTLARSIEFGGTEEKDYGKWRFPEDKYGELIDEGKEIIKTRHYNINLDSYESEEIEIRFHDGYSDYDDEIKEINKSKRFSIIAISLSILLILLLQ